MFQIGTKIFLQNRNNKSNLFCFTQIILHFQYMGRNLVLFSLTLTTLDLWIKRCDRVPTHFWFWKGQKTLAHFLSVGQEDISITKIKCTSRQSLCGSRLKSNHVTPHILITVSPDFILRQAELYRMISIRTYRPVPTLFIYAFFSLNLRLKIYCIVSCYKTHL